MDPVSVAFHTSKGLQLNIVDIEILDILYFLHFMHGVYFNTHGTYRGEICGRIIASEVQNNGYLQARYHLTSLLIWLAALGFSFAYFQLGFIFYSFIFANTAVLSTCGVLIFVHVGILKRLRQRSRYWRKRGEMESTKSDVQENQKTLINAKKDSKAVKALMIVLLAFFASFTPACVMIYFLNFFLGCVVC